MKAKGNISEEAVRAKLKEKRVVIASRKMIRDGTRSGTPGRKK